MKQLLIISGKGGTGKTTLASAFINMANCKAYADCDVDAPNLHLVTKIKSKAKESSFYGLDKAYINKEECLQCGLCQSLCRFEALKNNDYYEVDYYACEGCRLCSRYCPTQAISMRKAKSGDLKLYLNETIFSTAELQMGSGNSGKLVTKVKSDLRSLIRENEKLIIIDGSPGIGCPVIASLNGVDYVLVVAEPTISGINDMKRIIKTAQGLNIKILVCVNKYNINACYTQEIKEFCKENKVNYVGKIPFDKMIVTATNEGKSITEYDNSIAAEAIKKIFSITMDFIGESV